MVHNRIGPSLIIKALRAPTRPQRREEHIPVVKGSGARHYSTVLLGRDPRLERTWTFSKRNNDVHILPSPDGMSFAVHLEKQGAVEEVMRQRTACGRAAWTNVGRSRPSAIAALTDHDATLPAGGAAHLPSFNTEARRRRRHHQCSQHRLKRLPRWTRMRKHSWSRRHPYHDHQIPHGQSEQLAPRRD